MQITSRSPVVKVDESLVTVVVGHADVAFGDEVALEAVYDGKTYEGLYVAGIDTAPANEFAPEVYKLFGVGATDAFVALLSQRYRTTLAPDTPVTIYTLLDQPVEGTEVEG